MAQRLVHTALAHCADLGEVLLGVEKNNAQGFAIQKAHFAAEIADCPGTIDRQQNKPVKQNGRVNLITTEQATQRNPADDGSRYEWFY